MTFSMPNRKFTYRPQASLGIVSNLANVLSHGRTVGYVEMRDVPAFDQGNNRVFRPADNWQTSFSVKLQQELGLIEES